MEVVTAVEEMAAETGLEVEARVDWVAAAEDWAEGSAVAATAAGWAAAVTVAVVVADSEDREVLEAVREAEATVGAAAVAMAVAAAGAAMAVVTAEAATVAEATVAEGRAVGQSTHASARCRTRSRPMCQGRHPRASEGGTPTPVPFRRAQSIAQQMSSHTSLTRSSRQRSRAL